MPRQSESTRAAPVETLIILIQVLDAIHRCGDLQLDAAIGRGSRMVLWLLSRSPELLQIPSQGVRVRLAKQFALPSLRNCVWWVELWYSSTPSSNPPQYIDVFRVSQSSCNAIHKDFQQGVG